MSWVDVNADAVTKRWRPLTPAETSIVATLIEDACDLLEEDIEDLGYPTVDPSDERAARRYRRTIGNMVRRLLINPEGILEEGLDGEYNYKRDKALSSGALFVGADELDRFRPRTGRRRRGAFTITPS